MKQRALFRNLWSRRALIKALAAGMAGLGLSPGSVLAELAKADPAAHSLSYDEHIKDYLIKIRNFNQHHAADIFMDREQLGLLKSSVKRLKRLHRVVGYRNFHLLGFDEAVLYARNYSFVGKFPRSELDFLEKLFYEDAGRYGFLGDKPVKNFTDRICRQHVVKVPQTAHYLYRGEPLELYRKIKKELGDRVILTSGVRSVVKQSLLFLNKADNSRGNLSLASRQLAPPGYSFHGVADFDVGQVGFGPANFTERFIGTEVYKRLESLGYLTLRYPRDNYLGVRFEPWHIKVVQKA